LQWIVEELQQLKVLFRRCFNASALFLEYVADYHDIAVPLEERFDDARRYRAGMRDD